MTNKLLENFKLLSQTTKNLSEKRREVHRLWDKWVEAMFLRFYAEQVRPQIIVVDGEEIEYLLVDHESRTIIPVTSIYRFDGQSMDGVNQHSNTGDNSEHIQKDSSNSKEPSSGS